MNDKIKPFRKIEVALDRRELPFAADGILEHEVELWPVKCGFAFDASIR